MIRSEANALEDNLSHTWFQTESSANCHEIVVKKEVTFRWHMRSEQQEALSQSCQKMRTKKGIARIEQVAVACSQLKNCAVSGQ
ncbi:MAG: hypothetical protein A2107_00185 [Verrucomicrobia bacterium GWF2_62_7]|nr:MAG: hypothetical protein A2107_00185 [Verrucomicrobia bacterium GWF2_62_7]